MSGIKTRRLGRTGLEVSEIGLGTWPLAVRGAGKNYGGVEETKAIEVIDGYVRGGGNFLDSASGYNGVEKIIGKYLARAGNRAELIITSKTQGGEHADTLPKMDADLARSLEDLGTDYIDVYFLHLPPDEPAQIERAIEKMLSYKEAGKVRFIGASIKGPNVTARTQEMCDAYLATGQIDVIQVVYNILRQRNLSAIERAQQLDVGVVVRTVLESGFLTGAYQPGHVFASDDHRARYDREKLDTALRTVDELTRLAVQPPYASLPEVAIHFALRLPGLSCMILGAQDPDEVRMNLRALELPPLPSALVSDLRDRFGGLTEKVNFD